MGTIQSKTGRAAVEGVGTLINKFKGRKVGPHKISPEGDQDILIQELAERKMKEGMSREQAFDESERLVNTGANINEELPKSFGEQVLDNKGKIAAGTAAAVGTGMALQGDEAPFSELNLGKEKQPIREKAIDTHKKDVDNAQKAIDDKDKQIQKSIDDLLKGATADAAAFPMPGAYRPFQFERTDFAKDLKSDLTDIGTQYEGELAELDDKEQAGKDRAAMKTILKGLIDAAALMYLAKHAPTASYKGQTDPAEYDRELDRLEKHMATQRGLVKDKFGELRSQIKESYRTEERHEDRREGTQARDFQGKAQHAGQLQQARVGMFNAGQRAKDKRDSAQLRQLERLQKERAAAQKGTIPDKGLDKAAKAAIVSAERNNNKIFADLFEHADKVSPEEAKAKLLQMRATPEEVAAIMGDSLEFWGDDMKAVYDRFPPNFAGELAKRQIENVYGGTASAAPVAAGPSEAEVTAYMNKYGVTREKALRYMTGK